MRHSAWTGRGLQISLLAAAIAVVGHGTAFAQHPGDGAHGGGHGGGIDPLTAMAAIAAVVIVVGGIVAFILIDARRNAPSRPRPQAETTPASTASADVQRHRGGAKQRRSRALQKRRTAA